MSAAVFLDKDGTLLENLPYSIDPARIRLAPGAVEALRLLASRGYRLLVVSNQSGVARGYFAEAELAAVEDALRDHFARAGVRLDGFYYCPHHPRGNVAPYAVACECRKPAPGMLRRAALERGVDLPRSWMIGDILDDVEAGRRAGCGTVLIDNGGETEWRIDGMRRPDYVARDLVDASRFIVARRRS